MVLSTRISVLHRILVPRSEVRLLGGQQGGKPTPIPSLKGGVFNEKASVMGYGQRHKEA